jgi:hypothetical protein
LAIGASTGAVRATIPLTGLAETGRADGAGRVFVNIEDKDQIDVIDVAAKNVSARWSLYVAAAKPKASGEKGYDPDSFHVLVYGLR